MYTPRTRFRFACFVPQLHACAVIVLRHTRPVAQRMGLPLESEGRRGFDRLASLALRPPSARQECRSTHRRGLPAVSSAQCRLGRSGDTPSPRPFPAHRITRGRSADLAAATVRSRNLTEYLHHGYRPGSVTPEHNFAQSGFGWIYRTGSQKYESSSQTTDL